jgi:hypothetical protein
MESTSVWKRSKIWNDEDKEYVELYEEKEIRIPPKSHIIMSRHEASKFVHTWRDPEDKRTKTIRFPKILRIEPIYDYQGDKVDKFPPNACIICKMHCGSQMALKKHMAYAHPDVVQIKDPEKETKDDAGRPGNVSEEQV